MGDVVRFPRHVWAPSTGSGARFACSPARSSRVIPFTPRSAARLIRGSQCSPGIDFRERQELTVEGSRPSADATVLVRSAPMISSTVENMRSNIVGNLPTCQEFANLQSHCAAQVGEMRTMPDRTEIIAKRLIRTREAIGYLEQAEFCRQIKIDKTVYNPFEKGRRRITLDVAMKIRARFGISLDWIYCGDSSHLPGQLYEKLQTAA